MVKWTIRVSLHHVRRARDKVVVVIVIVVVAVVDGTAELAGAHLRLEAKLLRI